MCFGCSKKPSHSCADPGIFVRGGPGQSDKKKSSEVVFFFFFFFFSPQLILQRSNGQFQRIYHISRFQRGQTFSRGGGGGRPTFSRGSPIAYSYRNPYNL